MSLIEIWALWRKVKPWLDKLRPLLTALAALFKSAPEKPGSFDTTPELPRNHPDRERKWPDDWNSDNDPA